MFPTKEERIAQKENELLEIYILLEQNNYEATKEATIRYQRLQGIDRPSIALIEVKAKYKAYIEGLK